MKYYTILAFALLLSFAACKNKQDEKVVAPWGEVSDSIPANDNFDLDQIEANGEMIMVTLSGPESYYDYHGKSLGSLYMLAQKFADKVGVMLRVEVCRDSAEVTRKIASGDADLSALDGQHRRTLGGEQGQTAVAGSHRQLVQAQDAEGREARGSLPAQFAQRASPCLCTDAEQGRRRDIPL
jgi:hypothetical protein